MSQTIRFRPESKQAFSLYAGSLANHLLAPLQIIQELLACAYGYANLHEMQQDLKTPGASGPYAGVDARLDAARNARLVELLITRLGIDPALRSQLSHFGSTLGLFLPPQTHKQQIEELNAYLAEKEAQANAPGKDKLERDKLDAALANLIADEAHSQPESMRLAVLSNILEPGQGLPAIVAELEKSVCQNFRKRWLKTESFKGIKAAGLTLRTADVLYQRVETPPIARFVVLLDFTYQGEGDGPSVLHLQLQVPALQRTFDEVLEPFLVKLKVAALRIEPWRLAYRVTSQGGTILYRSFHDGPASSLVLDTAKYVANQAWVAFTLSARHPIRRPEGEFECIALMDVSSTAILGHEMIPRDDSQARLAALKLLERCLKNSAAAPGSIFVQRKSAADLIMRAAILKNIDTAPIAEATLLPIIEPVRTSMAAALREFVKKS